MAAPLRRTRAEWLALAALVLGYGAWALLLGQSNNWDLRNYHWYDGWAWLHGRGQLDLAVAQAQTWFNPLLPAALYLLLSTLPAWLGTFLLGCIQGLNLLPLHRICLHLLPAGWQQRRWLALLIAFAGASGATMRGELGASFGDNLVSLPLLGALALLLDGQDRGRVLGAGALLGLAAGLKLTAAPLAAGIVLAAPLLLADGAATWRARLRLSALLGICALAAFLLVNGHWMLGLYREFGNPLFPLFGHWFGGDFAPPAELRDSRWLPRGWREWLFYPLVWADTPRRVSEGGFLDLRLPLLFLAMLALPLWRRRALASAPALRRAADFVLLAVALAYLAWLTLFGYYRYLVVLEMLAPALLVLALSAMPRRAAGVAMLALPALLILATRPVRWGRLPHYSAQYVEVQLPPRADLAAALVVFGDGEPLGFLATAFPPGTRFVRIAGNLAGPPLPEWALDRAAQRRLRAHQGPLYLIAVDLDGAPLRQALQRHRLQLDRASCAGIASNLLLDEPLPQLCALRWEETP
ncbi:hypothetical protein [Tahibacter harae]|uniref:DUF2029 domain-containing protein n=1 Tax=Tahibacter harae TaxID=2963937 RepID=A0ABT1QR78_9GAMM|nr:hypothetical protein [Tahibacter harae]MCQ4164783.1 hypothetical protein [Tahibacter harae]